MIKRVMSGTCGLFILSSIWFILGVNYGMINVFVLLDYFDLGLRLLRQWNIAVWLRL